MEYEIRPDAKWDNGTPITGHDVAFTIRAIKNPLVNAPHTRLYFQFIQDVQVDAANPRKFTIIANRPYFLAESALGLQPILPKYHYDPDNLLEGFSIPDLTANGERLATNPALKRFAENFNHSRYQRDPEALVGSGPYRLLEWVPGSQLVFVRKENYWGNNATDSNLVAYPQRIVYKIINDFNNALVDLKGQRIDVMHNIPPRMFEKEMRENPRIMEHYNTHTIAGNRYLMVGMNNRPPQGRPSLFTDVRTRRAMAHLLDTPQLIQNVMFGHAQPIVGPVSPLLRKYYNDTLRAIPYSLDSARSLLTQAGWADTNGDGILDRTVGGTRIDFKATLFIGPNSPVAENTATLLRENAKKVGIEIEVQTLAPNALVEKMGAHDFDLVILGWTSAPNGGDLSQTWHSSQINGGSNYLGYASAEADAVMDSIKVTMDEGRRAHYYRKLQEILYRDQPGIFTMAPYRLIAIHKRFRNARASAVRPGFFPAQFWTPSEQVMYR
jgi:peptide/nickel transport system substrate-binding protein